MVAGKDNRDGYSVTRDEEDDREFAVRGWTILQLRVSAPPFQNDFFKCIYIFLLLYFSTFLSSC